MNKNTLEHITTNPCVEIPLSTYQGTSVSFVFDNNTGEYIETYQLALLNIRREIGLGIKYEDGYFSECSEGIYG